MIDSASSLIVCQNNLILVPAHFWRRWFRFDATISLWPSLCTLILAALMLACAKVLWVGSSMFVRGGHLPSGGPSSSLLALLLHMASIDCARVLWVTGSSMFVRGGHLPSGGASSSLLALWLVAPLRRTVGTNVQNFADPVYCLRLFMIKMILVCSSFASYFLGALFSCAGLVVANNLFPIGWMRLRAHC